MRILHDDFSIEDKLGHGPFRKAIIDLVDSIERDAKASFTIGIYGEWGSGKTSMLRQIEQHFCNQSNTVTIWFNPWRYHRADELIPILFQHISTALNNFVSSANQADNANTNTQKALKSFIERFTKAAKSISSSTHAKISLPGVSFDWKLPNNDHESENEKDIFYSMESFLIQSTASLDYRFIIFIDDLDRCHPERALELLEGIKVLLDISNFIFMIGLSHELLEKTAKQKYVTIEDSSATQNQNYLDKIIQFRAFLPRPRKDRVKETFFNTLLADMNNPDIYADTIVETIGTNPRTIKRFLNAVHFSLAYAKYRVDTCKSLKTELAIKCALIEYLYPRIYRLLEKNPSALVCLDQSALSKNEGINNSNDIISGISAIDDLIDNNVKINLSRILLADHDQNNFLDLSVASQYLGITSIAANSIGENRRTIANPEKGSHVINDFMSRMIMVNGGSFIHKGKRDNTCVVAVSNAFLISKYPVTQDIYKEVTNEDPSDFKGMRLPVVNVNWFDAARFCNRLSELQGLQLVYEFKDSDYIGADHAKNGYRLPTEAEWEFSSDPEGFSREKVDEIAWYMSNAGSATQEVGQKLGNKYGLYDVFGNVWEWCSDWHAPYEYLNKQNPLGPTKGDKKIIKGGSWSSFINNLSPSYRESHSPYTRDNHIGFRVVRST